MQKRNRRPKLFKVVREETRLVVFHVRATSALKAQMTPTPWWASRTFNRSTRGEATEVPVTSTADLYSAPGNEYNIAAGVE